MIDNASIDGAAEALADAYRNGTALDALPPAARPTTTDDAYRIQEALIARTGWQTAGWKVGATDARIQERLSISEPFGGRLLGHARWVDGAVVALGHDRPVFAEAEIAVRLKARLGPGEDPASAVEVLFPAIEIVSPRFADLIAAGGLQVIADNAGHDHFVAGAPEHDDWDASRLPALAVTLRVNGEVAATGSPAAVLGHPFNSLTWLAEHTVARGVSLGAGEVVTTGSCIGMVPVRAGDHLEADFGEFGQVRVDLA